MQIKSVVIILLCLINFCNLTIAQNIFGLKNNLDTIKYFNYDRNLGTIAYMNEDSTFTEINYVRNVKVYERVISIDGTDTTFEIKNFHYCNGKIAREFIQNKKDKLTTIKKLYSPEGEILYKGKMDYINGNGREYFYNYNECELYSVEIKNYRNFLLQGPHIELKSIKGDTMFVYNYNKGKLNGKFKKFQEGKIIETRMYKNGILEGEIKYFDNNGKVLFKELYENGKVIKTIKSTLYKPELEEITFKVVNEILSNIENSINDSIGFNKILSNYFADRTINPYYEYIYHFTFDRLWALKQKLILNKSFDVKQYIRIADAPLIDYNGGGYYCQIYNNNTIESNNIVVISCGENKIYDTFYFYFNSENKIFSIRPIFLVGKIQCFE